MRHVPISRTRYIRPHRRRDHALRHHRRPWCHLVLLLSGRSRGHSTSQSCVSATKRRASLRPKLKRESPSCQTIGSRSAFAADEMRGIIMSRRTIVSLAAAALVGIVCAATISTDAFAQPRGRVVVGRAGVARVHPGVGVGLGAAALGAAALGAAAAGAAAAAPYGYPYAYPYAYPYRPACGYYPYGPCY